VDGPKDLGEELGIRGVLLELDEVEIELIEVLAALLEERLDDLGVVGLH
jgi:hypothetical protein